MAYSNYYTKDNQPNVGEVCILVDADSNERLEGAIDREVVVLEEMDAQGHVYIESEDIEGCVGLQRAYVDLWQLAPTKDVADMQLYSKDNKPSVGTLVYITEDAWYEPYHNTYQVVDRLDSTDVWIKDSTEYPRGICIASNAVAKPVPRDNVVGVTSEEVNPIEVNLVEVDPYDLPCDFKVGDEVESLIYGAGTVMASTDSAFPVRVRFDDGSEGTHTSCGRWLKYQQRTLFHEGTVKLVAVEQQYKPQYNTGDCLFAMKDGKITVLKVKQDYKDRIVDDEDFVFLKSEFTFHPPA